MTDKTQPLALMLAEQYDYGDPVAHSNTWKAAVCTELRSQHARIAELEARVQELGAMARENRSRRIVELEAQLEAVGAGGVQALSAAPAVPAVPAGWVERWHGSGGKEFWEGWSILNAANREMIAHLGPDVDPDAVRDIVAAHNEALCGECAGTGGRWCPACAGATPPAEQAAPKAAPGEPHDHQILAITTAYEQGVGKGRQAYSSGKEIANPYGPGYRCDLAWQYGDEEGKEQAERIAEAAPQQGAQEPVALLVRKNSWRAGQWEAAPPDSPSYGLAWANQRQYVYAAPQPTPAPLSDDVVKDAARWRMAVMIGNEVMLHPEDRTQAAAVKAYMDATRSGATLTGAVDAALAAQGDTP